VQGGCWGSEAKGTIAAFLCKERKVDIAIRTGATNAGHSVVYKDTKYVNKQIPTGWVNPSTQLVIGAGALIDPEILARETAMISQATGEDANLRLNIDYRAALHVPAHEAKSKASGRHHSIGATGRGCSEALIDRIKGRGDSSYILFGDSPCAKNYDVCDTESYLNWAWDEGAQLLLEGTQGQMLDLYLGPYPYTTHKQTGPAQWMLECGLSPRLPTEIVMVVRTFPIRVAGNSGPMPQEISWPILAREINGIRMRAGMPEIVDEQAIVDFEAAVAEAGKAFDGPENWSHLNQHEWDSSARVSYQKALSEVNKAALDSLPAATTANLSRLFEMTTVTKKLRRIARIDEGELKIAARQIRPSWIALTFLNYLFPQHWYELPNSIEGDQIEFIKWVEEACHAPVKLVSYGPEDSHVLRTNR
jgi:adenylosuccinate synthase